MINDRLIYRHRLWLRITHWINVACMTILLMSGLQIFNAHPALYWGDASNFDRPLIAIDGFPNWATLPGIQWLAMGRRWHFFFAWLFIVNGVVYLLLTILAGIFAAISCRHGGTCGGLATQSGSTCGCVSRRARKQGATMSCKNSPIWWCWLCCVR
jgi:hypothetical protein